MYKLIYKQKIVIRSLLWLSIAAVGFIVLKRLYHFGCPQRVMHSAALVRPVLHSLDDQGNPYQISGERITQTNDSVFHITQPKASMSTPKDLYTLQGRVGRYDKQAKQIWLNGSVHLATSDGHHITTQKAQADLIHKITYGKNAVQGHGPLGEFRATGFQLDPSTLLLEGPAKIILHP